MDLYAVDLANLVAYLLQRLEYGITGARSRRIADEHRLVGRRRR